MKTCVLQTIEAPHRASTAASNSTGSGSGSSSSGSLSKGGRCRRERGSFQASSRRPIDPSPRRPAQPGDGQRQQEAAAQRGGRRRQRWRPRQARTAAAAAAAAARCRRDNWAADIAHRQQAAALRCVRQAQAQAKEDEEGRAQEAGRRGGQGRGAGPGAAATQAAADAGEHARGRRDDGGGRRRGGGAGRGRRRVCGPLCACARAQGLDHHLLQAQQAHLPFSGRDAGGAAVRRVLQAPGLPHQKDRGLCCCTRLQRPAGLQRGRQVGQRPAARAPARRADRALQDQQRRAGRQHQGPRPREQPPPGAHPQQLWHAPGPARGPHAGLALSPGPAVQGRRAVTFHNQRDFIFFRHHRYIFEEKEKKKQASGGGGGSTVVQARMQELGPRFTLKLLSLQKGTFDSRHGEYEWVHKHKQMDTSRRRFHL